jgi:hypothetical protein
MDDGLTAIVERFLAEHVMVGLGNVRTRLDLLEGERIGADEPPSLDLRAIAGQIDRLESHARALQFLLRDSARATPPPRTATPLATPLPAPLPSSLGLQSDPAGAATARAEGSLTPEPARTPTAETLTGFRDASDQTAWAVAEPGQPGDDDSPRAARTQSVAAEAAAPNTSGGATGPGAPAPGTTAPPTAPTPADPLLAAIAREVARAGASTLPAAAAPQVPTAGAGAAPAAGTAEVFDTTGSEPARAPAETAAGPQEQAPAADAPQMSEPVRAPSRSVGGPLLLTDPAVPPVLPTASLPVFTSRRRRAGS